MIKAIVDMKRIIDNMMTWFNISEKTLREKQEIPTPIGQTLYWDYYCYVKENPIYCWSNPTSILYGKNDNICEFDFVSAFSKKFNCNLQVAEDAEHYFHTLEQISCFRNWLKKHITAD